MKRPPKKKFLAKKATASPKKKKVVMQSIHATEQPLKKVFSDEYQFEIPGYQRPYSWTTEQASELFADLVGRMEDEDSSDPYFLGSIVLIKSEGDPHAQVIDGQQRLTTLTILLAAIADRLSGDAKRSTLKYINEPGDVMEGLEAKPRLSLRERDQEFFSDNIQTEDAIGGLSGCDLSQLSDAQANIAKNAAYLIERLADYEDEWCLRLGQFVASSCFLVVVSTPSLESAYRIFSVMNDRGMDLLPADILKAEIIGRIDDEADREAYTEKWEDAEEALGRGYFSELFSHIRMIYRKAKLKKTILEEFKEYVFSKEDDPKEFVDEVLVPYADAYEILLTAGFTGGNKTQVGEINDLLGWLSRIDNFDWVPPLLQFLKEKPSASDALAFLNDYERLAAMLFVCRRTVNERIDRYARLMGEMESGEDLEADDSALQLTHEEQKDFLRVLGGDLYLEHPKVRSYVLLRLDSLLADGSASYDHSVLTVEHVLPQSPDDDSEWLQNWPDEAQRDRSVHTLGNLVLLARKRNSAAGNFDFEKKKKKYFSTKDGVSPFALTTTVLDQDEWTPDVVEARQKEMISLLKKGWRLSTKKPGGA